MAPGLKTSMIVACLALGAAGCSQDRGRAMSPVSTQTQGAVSNEDATQQTTSMGGSMMQQCNVIKGRVGAGVGLTPQMQAMVPQCERMLGAGLTNPAGGTAPSPAALRP